MKALTLWRPWPWAILHAGKRIENRVWAPPASIVGRVIAIHAGKRWDGDAVWSLMAHGHSPPGDNHIQCPTGIVGIARVTGHVTESDDPWFSGPFGWTLDDVVALPRPIPWHGAQGLWTVVPALVREIEAQLGGPVE